MTETQKAPEPDLHILGVPCYGIPQDVVRDYHNMYDRQDSPVKTATTLGLLAAYGQRGGDTYTQAINFLRGKLLGIVSTAYDSHQRLVEDYAELKKSSHVWRKNSITLNTVVRRAAIVTGKMSEFEESKELNATQTLECLFAQFAAFQTRADALRTMDIQSEPK